MQIQKLLNIQNLRAFSNQKARATALVLLAAIGGLVAQANSGNHSANDPKSGTIVQKSKPKWYQIGKASWYGHQFQGRKTASGEAFDFHMLTCAHRTLPIGTLLRVTNLGNRRSIMVRVNDRGPVPEARIIDLSYAAARSLGFNSQGQAHVKLEKVEGAEAAQLNWPNLGYSNPNYSNSASSNTLSFGR